MGVWGSLENPKLNGEREDSGVHTGKGFHTLKDKPPEEQKRSWSKRRNCAREARRRLKNPRGRPLPSGHWSACRIRRRGAWKQ